MTDTRKLVRLATLVMAADIVFVVVASFLASSDHAQQVVSVIAAVVFVLALVPGLVHLARTFGSQGERAWFVNIAVPLALAIAAAVVLWLVGGWSGGGPFFGAVFVFALYQMIAGQRRRRRKNVAG